MAVATFDDAQPDDGSPSLRAARRGASLVGIIGRLLATASAEGPSTPTLYAERAARTARTILAVHGVDVRTTGPVLDGPFIVVSNHVSYLDPLLVSAVVPCISIAKGETSAWPLVGPGLRALGVVFVRRGDPYSGALALRQAWRAVKGGVSVLNFPEGTTSDGRSVGPFRRGVFGLAALTQTPILPVRIAFDDDRVPWFGGSTFAPHYWKLAGVERVAAHVRLGPAVATHRGDDARALAKHVHDIVASL
jgi:1-acyl-sn-glycerol-3-phosphate acyltransferase